jgi:hypothetical protein
VTADVRQQLTEALARAEAETNAADMPSDFVLRLVERDRELLRRYDVATRGATHPVVVSLLRDLVDQAAAFWLGTPEVDR